MSLLFHWQMLKFLLMMLIDLKLIQTYSYQVFKKRKKLSSIFSNLQALQKPPFCTVWILLRNHINLSIRQKYMLYMKTGFLGHCPDINSPKVPFSCSHTLVRSNTVAQVAVHGFLTLTIHSDSWNIENSRHSISLSLPVGELEKLLN